MTWLLFVVLFKLQPFLDIAGGSPVLKTQGVSASNPASIPNPPAINDGGTSIDPSG